MSKHEYYELKQKQSLPLEAKIRLTQRAIKEWVQYWRDKGEDVYVAWSGGKDSTVLKHIVEQLNLDIKNVFADTGLEYPEIKEFVKKDKNLVVIRPQKPFWQVVRDYGYPIISKEASECINNARKHLVGGGYDQHYRKLFAIGEYATKSTKDSRCFKEKEFP